MTLARIKLALALTLVAASVAFPLTTPNEPVWINEFHYDNAGTDTGEFIEVAGIAGTNLSSYQLVLYNGANGLTYDTIALAGIIPNQDDGQGTVSFGFPTNGIQNGAPDGFALVESGSVKFFLSYEGAFTALDGPANGLLSTDVGVAETGSTLIGESLQLIGTGNKYEDFTWSGPSAESPGAVNSGQDLTGAGGPPPPPPFDGVLLPQAGEKLTIGFDGFAGAGFSPTPAANQLDSDSWRAVGASDGTMNYGDTQTGGDFARGLSSGGVTTGGVYAFDHGGGDVGLGVQPAGSDFTPGFLELRLLNDTGLTVDNVDVMYDIWVYNDQPRANVLNFAYSTDGINFTDVPLLDFTSDEAAAASPAWEMVNRATSLSGLGLANGQFLYLRWILDDATGSSNRDEFAIDNIMVTNVAQIPEPVSLGLLALASVTLVQRRRRVT